ncbi:tripartite tricarboxylate transporter TctB family protein [Cricetibacter osteomyelitidis]|uniref:Tripartite tricarboxylate transporter TctB family protein n=1 Tax=Cricetibacter osteomyelitidis TaxID=1521931 RepID=A0A4R2SNV5_9PAST|nr:tripartite tricarboxylate transporter TctB family protein [Cricetibacter osteomyelitidis]TCP90121.1 tripartite tricarboxylate transporter TctB family protein [Cricetibacter osteomyelitidis]
MKKYLSDKNFMAGFIFFFVSVFYLINAFLIETKNVVSVEADFMPKIYGSLLLISSLMLLITSLRRLSVSDSVESNNTTDWRRVLAVLGLIFVYVVSMQYLGFILVSIPFLFCLSLLLTPNYVKKVYWIYAVFSILLPIIAYFTFSHYLSLTMPSGIFF